MSLGTLATYITPNPKPSYILLALPRGLGGSKFIVFYWFYKQKHHVGA